MYQAPEIEHLNRAVEAIKRAQKPNAPQPPTPELERELADEEETADDARRR